MQIQPQQDYYTPEEYLVLEEAAKFRSEYRDGEIVPMTGGSINHNCIVVNSHLAPRCYCENQSPKNR